MAKQAPKMTLQFTHPKYWATWFGLGIIWVITQLPAPMIWSLGNAVGRLIRPLLKRRLHIARTNLALCYPAMPEEEREQLLTDNLLAHGRGIFEMGMGWWWSDRRVQSISEIEGKEYVDAFYQQGRSVVAITIHNVNLEMNARVLGLRIPAVNFYRPHNNALLEYMQYHGRLRSNKMQVSKRDVKTLFNALKEPNLIVYLPDHDYGPERAEFVPFCGPTLAATTTAIHNIVKRSHAGVVLLVPLWTGSGYKVKLLPAPEQYPTGDDKRDCEIINQAVASMIAMAPEQYLWTHRRFKTRPPESPQTIY